MDMKSTSIYNKISDKEMETIVQDIVSKSLSLRKNEGNKAAELFNDMIFLLNQKCLNSIKISEQDAVKAKVCKEVIYALGVIKKIGYKEPEIEFEKMWNEVKPGVTIKEDYMKKEKHLIDENEKKRVAMRMKIYRQIADQKCLSYESELASPYWHALYIQDEGEKNNSKDPMDELIRDIRL